MKKWFSKDKKQENEGGTKKDTGSISEFKDVLDQSIKEERTQVLITKKQESRNKAMVRNLLNGGYSIEEINSFLTSGKSFELKDGEIIEV